MLPVASWASWSAPSSTYPNRAYRDSRSRASGVLGSRLRVRIKNSEDLGGGGQRGEVRGVTEAGACVRAGVGWGGGGGGNEMRRNGRSGQDSACVCGCRGRR